MHRSSFSQSGELPRDNHGLRVNFFQPSVQMEMGNCADSSTEKGNSWNSDLPLKDCFRIRIPHSTAAVGAWARGRHILLDALDPTAPRRVAAAEADHPERRRIGFVWTFCFGH
jgi:hypothetical protein